MQDPSLSTRLSTEEYLEQERQLEARHEFYRGELFSMGGASRRHNTIAVNTLRLLANHLLESPCQAYMSDMRLRIAKHEHYVYPDILVVCKETAYQNEDMVDDARLIIEILSQGTESYDRGEKFQHYQSLPSLQEYVLISQHQVLVEVFRRGEATNWIYHKFVGEKTVLDFPSLEFSCVLGELYRSVVL